MVANSGQANVAFVQLLPILSPQVIHCLREQYSPLPSTVYTSFPVRLAMRAVGRADNGDGYKTNTVTYTLTLRHTCGNGRIDDGEVCDPEAAVNPCLLGECSSGFCGTTSVPCVTTADCVGGCIEQGNPMECTCQYSGASN